MSQTEQDVGAMGLLPCPFCGGEARRHTIGQDEPNNAGGDVIVCTRCQASSHVEFGRKENLVLLWNTRTAPEQPSAPEASKAVGYQIKLRSGRWTRVLYPWSDATASIRLDHALDMRPLYASPQPSMLVEALIDNVEAINDWMDERLTTVDLAQKLCLRAALATLTEPSHDS